jgi:hypothetical protein
LMWSRDESTSVSARSWFERARRENLATLVASHQRGAPTPAGAGTARAELRDTIDDDDHLAAYNAYLARLHQQPPSGTS